MANKGKLPPGCGLDLHKTVLFNPYVHSDGLNGRALGFHAARRLRKCSACHVVVSLNLGGALQCPMCAAAHHDNTSFPRLYKSLHLRAGRRSGKSQEGAVAVREELSIPNQKWWVCGPTFKILHDATMPTLLRRIPPSWVANWNQDNLELSLLNGSVVQFRSLDDPERGRGQGLHGAWIDEAAFCAERAWHVLAPSLAENAGIVISTTSPGGFDWTYKTFYRRAITEHRPGYWAAKFRTLDNPLFQQSAVLRREVEEARLTMTPEVFAAEYEGDDVNFTGVIYGQAVESQVLETDEAVQRLIPEWPAIDASRHILIGLDSGADHPFGAVLIVVTESGLVVVGEYLSRQQAHVTHLGAIQQKFRCSRFPRITWAANKNEAQLRLEFGLRNVMVVPAENKHQVGLQRVQSWLLTKQLYFVAARCPQTIEQMRTYRYADNYQADGQKRDQEKVFKKEDELPDAVRYAIMAWPELPKTASMMMTDREQKRWDNYDDRTKLDIERIRAFNKQELEKDLNENDPTYPIGDMFGHVESLFDA